MKYDLSDTTFALIVKLDTIERLENIFATTSFILTHFETNVNVSEVSYRYNGYLKKLLDPKVKYQLNMLYHPNPVDSAFFYDLAFYKESGLENEHFYSLAA